MSKYREMTHEEVLTEYKKYMNDGHLAFVESAYKFAKNAHEGQFRVSGQSHITHPTQVTGTLAILRLDPDIVATGYLHDTVENTPVTNDDIKEKFRKDTIFIVDNVTRLSKIQYKPKSHEEYLADNHHKILIAMAKDLRVVMVRLADRLHSMRTLDYLRPDRRRKIADETLDIYVPLADRLGVGTVKWGLEDMNLHYLNPQQYYRTANSMQSKRGEREGYITDAIKTLKQTLNSSGVEYEVYGRPRHIYSIYERVVNKHKDFGEIYDLLVVRVIVRSVRDCYAVLGVVHAKWKPAPGRFKDYITVPEVNGYQPLHTTIIGPGGKPLEIQIRTEAVHQVAEYSVAAHWAYREGVKDEVEQADANKRLNMLQEILKLRNETKDSHELMKSVKTDIFSDRVYVFTLKGDVYGLPKGSVPLDLAYMAHSEVGAHSVGAGIGGKIVPLDYKLRNGDVAGVLTQTSARPSRDWVRLVKTLRAGNEIRHFFKAKGREEDIEKDQNFIEQELLNRDLVPKEFMDKEHIQKVINHFNYYNKEGTFVAVGHGETSTATVANRSAEDLRKKTEDERQQQLEEKIMNAGQQSSTGEDDSSDALADTMRIKHNNGVMAQGVSSLMLHLAKYCNPAPRDPIINYVTKERGVTIHRVDCSNITKETKKQGRLIDMTWENIAKDKDKENYNADIKIYGPSRSRPLSDVINALNSKTKNIISISGEIDSNNMAHIYAAVPVRDTTHLEDVLSRVRDVLNVYEAKKSVS